MARQYDGPADAIAAGVQQLVAELQAEDLIVPAAQPAAAALSPLAPENGQRPRFQPPVLEKFTDMADLLLLDPIHEVDEMGGWPHPAPAKG